MNDQQKAEHVIDVITMDPGSWGPGQRNDDTVDFCIAQYVLGAITEEEQVSKILDCNHPNIMASREPDKVRTIHPYLNGWASTGNIFKFCCRSDYHLKPAVIPGQEKLEM